MSKHCLSKKELSQILFKLLDSEPWGGEDLDWLYAEFESWEKEIVILNYFLLFVYQQSKNANEEILNKLYGACSNIYEFSNDRNISIGELDEDFIKFLISNLKNENLTLADNLALYYNKYCNHEYDTYIRN